MECFRLNRKPVGIFPVLLYGVMAFSCLAFERTENPLEYEIKSEFILRFTEYIDWPTESFEGGDSTFNICTLGDGPLPRYLGKSLDKVQIKGRLAEVRHLNPGDPIQNCQILYIAPSQRKDLQAHLKKVSHRPVLTIGDAKGFEKSGVLINLFVEGSHIRFAINAQAFKEKRLKVSSKLLVLSKPVATVN